MHGVGNYSVRPDVFPAGLRPLADVAHRAGKRIAIHSYGPDGARDAVRAGAESVEHATDMDDATLARSLYARYVGN